MPSDEMESRSAARAEAVRRSLIAAFPSRPPRGGRGISWVVGKEMDELPGLLADDETIEIASVGSLEGRGVLIVATDRRLVVFDRGWGRRTFYEYAYADVEKVEWRKGLRSGEIVVVPRSGLGLRVKNVAGNHVKPLGQWLVRRLKDSGVDNPKQD